MYDSGLMMETAWISKTSQYSFFFTVTPPTEITRRTVLLKYTSLLHFSVFTVLKNSLLVTSEVVCLEVVVEETELPVFSYVGI